MAKTRRSAQVGSLAAMSALFFEVGVRAAADLAGAVLQRSGDLGRRESIDVLDQHLGELVCRRPPAPGRRVDCVVGVVLAPGDEPVEGRL